MFRDRIDVPLRWRKPRRVFVCSVCDLFHEAVEDEWLDLVFAVMALCPGHTFLVLTKRAERMRRYVEEAGGRNRFLASAAAFRLGHGVLAGMAVAKAVEGWPLKNVWLGVTAENQARADERVPVLLGTAAARRFVSVEPMLGPVDLDAIETFGDDLAVFNALDKAGRGFCVKGDYSHGAGLDWVIAGPETGRGKRPCEAEWIDWLFAQCRRNEVPFWDKGKVFRAREMP